MDKLFRKAGMLLMPILSLFLCVSCSDDDDDVNNGGGKVSAYVKADGVETKFTYGYYVDDDGYIEVLLCDYDYLYYYNHPDKIKDSQIVSECFLDFEKINIINGNITDYGLEVELNMSLKAMYEEDDDNMETPQSIGYWNGWIESPIQLTFSNGKISASGNSIEVLASERGEAIVWDSNSRKTTLDLFINGQVQNITSMFDDYDYDDYSSRSSDIELVEIKDDNAKAFFRKLHRR